MDSEPRVSRWTAAHTAAMAAFLPTLLLAAIGARSGSQDRYALATFALVFLSGLIAGLLHRLRLHAWLTGFAAGLLLAAAAVVELLTSAPFDEAYFVGIMTIAFFLGLFFFFGAIAELVRLIHQTLHRRGPR